MLLDLTRLPIEWDATVYPQALLVRTWRKPKCSVGSVLLRLKGRARHLRRARVVTSSPSEVGRHVTYQVLTPERTLLKPVLLHMRSAALGVNGPTIQVVPLHLKAQMKLRGSTFMLHMKADDPRQDYMMVLPHYNPHYRVGAEAQDTTLWDLLVDS